MHLCCACLPDSQEACRRALNSKQQRLHWLSQIYFCRQTVMDKQPIVIMSVAGITSERFIFTESEK